MEFLSPGVNPQSWAEKIAYLCSRAAGANGQQRRENNASLVRGSRSLKSAFRFRTCQLPLSTEAYSFNGTCNQPRSDNALRESDAFKINSYLMFFEEEIRNRLSCKFRFAVRAFQSKLDIHGVIYSRFQRIWTINLRMQRLAGIIEMSNRYIWN